MTTKKFIPKTPVNFPLLMHSIVSFHIQMIMYTEQQEEAVFHWRQVKYYNHITHEMLGTAELDMAEYYRDIKESGKGPLIIKAIDKFNLLEVE